ncbi:hypothetical protein [Microcoleus sp. B3-A4]|uniref:hypothetical protein n=1 Tax=Microcoleus sp. B3-A4 TaxID=2818653 RepID=UPI002FD401B9
MIAIATLPTTSNFIGVIPWMWLWLLRFGTERQLMENSDYNWSQSLSINGSRHLTKNAGSGGDSHLASDSCNLHTCRSSVTNITHELVSSHCYIT